MPERILEVGQNARQVIKISQAATALKYLRDEISGSVKSQAAVMHIDAALEVMHKERESAIIARAA